jgi:thymidylate synthase (FAD)
MGDDLRVVNAARVSFDKESEWDWEYEKESGVIVDMIPKLSEKDQKLISYLAKHNHWTPFSHVNITMRETVPIFVARQRFKHVVGFTYNETSRRYVDDNPAFYIPSEWRGKADNAKQGSSDQIIYNILDVYGEAYSIDSGYIHAIEQCEIVYNDMIRNGVAPEQARMVLPQSMYTSYYVTGSLAAWARAYQLRIDPHAQKEIQDLAVQWDSIITSIPELKYSWSALTDKKE